MICGVNSSPSFWSRQCTSKTFLYHQIDYNHRCSMSLLLKSHDWRGGASTTSSGKNNLDDDDERQRSVSTNRKKQSTSKKMKRSTTRMIKKPKKTTKKKKTPIPRKESSKIHPNTLMVSSNSSSLSRTSMSSTSLPSGNKPDSTTTTIYTILAQFVQKQWKKHHPNNDDEKKNNKNVPTVPQLIQSFHSLQSSQSTFKGIDGAAHEVYQRRKRKRSSSSRNEHNNNNDHDNYNDNINDSENHNRYDEDSNEYDQQILSVSGRAQRNVDRTCAVANGLFSCELFEIIQDMGELSSSLLLSHYCHENSTSLVNANSTMRSSSKSSSSSQSILLLNVTNAIPLNDQVNISIIVLWQPHYHGGAGINHGTIHDLMDQPYDMNNDDDNTPTKSQRCRGRLLIMVHDSATHQLMETMVVLDHKPIHVPLQFVDDTSQKQETNKNNKRETSASTMDDPHDYHEIASVSPILYHAASKLLHIIEPHLHQYVRTNHSNNGKNTMQAKSSDPYPHDATETNNTRSSVEDNVNDKSDDDENNRGIVAIHFVGRSLGGGVAAIAAAMLNGNIPVMSTSGFTKGTKAQKNSEKEKTKTKKRKGTKQNNKDLIEDDQKVNTKPNIRPLQGLGYRHTSAFIIGAPPCISSNVPTEYITSILYGDDIICRTSYGSIDRFIQRTHRAYQFLYHKYIPSFLGKQYYWMTDTLSLTSSNLQTHAIGSDGEEMKITIPGRSYLIRPRRLLSSSSQTNSIVGCSIHEIGTIHLKGGREALRANVLWQLNDILLSPSLWKHHQLNSYIHGLDGVQLRDVTTGVSSAT
jgi:hypothetical protein